MSPTPESYARIPHAYGPATDAPEHLRLLASGEPAAMETAWRYLYSAIMHQDTPFPAAVPVLDDLIGLMHTQPDAPATAEIVDFVALMAAVITDNGEPMTALRAQVVSEAAESLVVLAQGGPEDNDELWDVAWPWTLLHIAETLPRARVALEPLAEHPQDTTRGAALEALKQLDAADTVLNSPRPNPNA